MNRGRRDCNIMIPDNIDNFDELFNFTKSIALEFGGQYLEDKFLTGDAFLISNRVLDKIGT